MIASSISSAPGAASPAPVSLPTILDGVRYEAAAFNELNRDLQGRVTLHYLLMPGESDILFAFTSAEGLKSFVAGRNERAVARMGSHSAGRPLAARIANHGTCSGHQDARTSIFYVDVNCSAVAGFGANAPWSNSDLTPLGFNDTIRSLTCAFDTTYTQYCVMYEHAGFQGASLWVLPNGFYDNLATVGWADRISSIILYAPAR